MRRSFDANLRGSRAPSPEPWTNNSGSATRRDSLASTDTRSRSVRRVTSSTNHLTTPYQSVPQANTNNPYYVSSGRRHASVHSDSTHIDPLHFPARNLPLLDYRGRRRSKASPASSAESLHDPDATDRNYHVHPEDDTSLYSRNRDRTPRRRPSQVTFVNPWSGGASIYPDTERFSPPDPGGHGGRYFDWRARTSNNFEKLTDDEHGEIITGSERATHGGSPHSSRTRINEGDDAAGTSMAVKAQVEVNEERRPRRGFAERVRRLFGTHRNNHRVLDGMEEAEVQANAVLAEEDVDPTSITCGTNSVPFPQAHHRYELPSVRFERPTSAEQARQIRQLYEFEQAVLAAEADADRLGVARFGAEEEEITSSQSVLANLLLLYRGSHGGLERNGPPSAPNHLSFSDRNAARGAILSPEPSNGSSEATVAARTVSSKAKDFRKGSLPSMTTDSLELQTSRDTQYDDDPDGRFTRRRVHGSIRGRRLSRLRTKADSFSRRHSLGAGATEVAASIGALPHTLRRKAPSLNGLSQAASRNLHAVASNRPALPAISALMATTGNLMAVASPEAASIGPDPFRGGHALSKYSSPYTPPLGGATNTQWCLPANDGDDEGELTEASRRPVHHSRSLNDLSQYRGAEEEGRPSFASSWRRRSRASSVSSTGTNDGLFQHRGRRPSVLSRLRSIGSATLGGSVLDLDLERGGGGRRGSSSAFTPLHSGRNTPDWRRAKARARKRQREIFITMHIAAILQRQNFVLRLGRALMTHGAPSHRIEAQLSAAAKVLDIDAQFFYFPSILIVSFGDPDTHTSSTHFVKQGAADPDVEKLLELHSIYRKVIHDEMSAEEGAIAIKELSKRPPCYGQFITCVFGGLCSMFGSGYAFTASFLDIIVAGVLGFIVIGLQVRIAVKNPLFSYVYEVFAAFSVSFIAQGLASTGHFCFESVVAGGLVILLPGYSILFGALELASKNVVAGSVRMLYAVVYSLFLGFGITLGYDAFTAIYPLSHEHIPAAEKGTATMVSIHGTFAALNSSSPLGAVDQGTFTFANTTSSALEAGHIVCYRDAAWPWYQQTPSLWWKLLFIPGFSLFLSLYYRTRLTSRELPIALFICCASEAAVWIVSQHIGNRAEITSAVGSFVIGIMGNLYSRFGRGSAFPSMLAGVLVLVPGNLAVAGGLTLSRADDSPSGFSSEVFISLRMLSVVIGITMGLFMSSLIVYPIPKLRGALFSF